MSAIATSPKELIAQLSGIGLVVRKDTGSGHHKVYDPKTDAWLFNVSSSPSDVNWFWNIKRHLRRLGLLEVFENRVKPNKKRTAHAAIDLDALKKAQDLAAARGEHIPLMEDLEDSTEFFTRLKLGAGGDAGFGAAAQKESIDIMVAKADAPRVNSTRGRLEKFFGSEKGIQLIEARDGKRKGTSPIPEFVRIAIEEVAPGRGLKAWKNTTSGEVSIRKFMRGESMALWSINLVEATMDKIDGLQWSETMTAPPKKSQTEINEEKREQKKQMEEREVREKFEREEAEAQAVAEAQVAEDKRNEHARIRAEQQRQEELDAHDAALAQTEDDAELRAALVAAEDVREELVALRDDLQIELVSTNSIADKYADVLLAKIEAYDLKDKADPSFLAILERLDKLAGI